MRTSREEFLHCLEAVQPGLSAREIVEQSSHFCFKDGKIWTYNDEICCRCPFPAGFDGAVKAEPLLDQLRKWNEDEIAIEASDAELIIIGKGRKAGFGMEKTIALPTDQVETPKEWRKLPDMFGEAVSLVGTCAGKNEKEFPLPCVHLHPKFLEACDRFQLCRWNIRIPVDEASLVRQSALRHVTTLGMAEIAESKSWLHFRNARKLVISVRRYADEYRDFTALLKDEGSSPVTLPKSLAEAAERAQVFAKQNQEEENQSIRIELRPGRLRVKGQGTYGWYSETKKSEWSGKELDFFISSEILKDVVKRHNEVKLSDTRLRVEGENYTFVTVLGRVESPEEKAEREEEKREVKRRLEKAAK